MSISQSILVIDDDLGIRDGLTVLLQKYFNVESAASGKEAVDIIKKRKHDIYIIDLFLGDMNGLEILAFIKKKHSNVITIILTGYGNDDDVIKAKKLGANEFLHKPISAKELKTVIDNLNRQKYNFISSEKAIEISYKLINEINIELIENFKIIKDSINILKDKIFDKYQDDLNEILLNTNNYEKKFEFIENLIKLKTYKFEDKKGDIQIKSAIEKSLHDFAFTDVYKRIIVEDNKSYVFVKAFQLLSDIMISMLNQAPKSVLKVSKTTRGIELEIINIDLTIQETFNNEKILVNFPYIEFNLLKEILRFTDSHFNIKKDGPYTNLIVVLKNI